MATFVLLDRAVAAFDLLGSMVQVQVEGSVATLSGTVSTLAVKNAALQLVRDTGGVSKAIDRLHASIVTPKANPDIEADARAALASDATLSREPIQVLSAAGLLTLSGTVQSQHEKVRAGQLVIIDEATLA